MIQYIQDKSEKKDNSPEQDSSHSMYYLNKKYRTLIMLPSHFERQVSDAQVTYNTAALSPGFIFNLIYFL